MTLRLLLIRHGLSSYNLQKRVQGRDDQSVLTAEGIEQALKTGGALSGLEINAIYSSPLKRAAATTENILKNLKGKIEPIFDENLLEVDLDDWSGKKIDELERSFPEAFKIWQDNPRNLEITKTNGEKYRPIQELIDQARNFINTLIQDHQNKNNFNIVIVAHNAILRCLILVLLGEPNNGFRRIKLDNASISVINLDIHKKDKFKCQIECLNNTTHLNNNLPKKGNYSRIILVRHGETDWNLQGRFQGQIDIPLNKNGKEQGACAGSFLSNEQLDKAYSSSLSRPIETGNLILQSHRNISLKLKKELIEIGHGLWEGKLESEIQAEWPNLLEDWKKKPDTVEMPEGESIQMVWERSVRCFNSICNELEEDETALVVAHDAVNKTILCHLLGLSPSDIWMVKQGNGAVTVIDTSKNPNQPNVITCLNLTSHLGGVIDCTASGAL